MLAYNYPNVNTIFIQDIAFCKLEIKIAAYLFHRT